jgi:uncharacterized protein (DUF2062 family)
VRIIAASSLQETTLTALDSIHSGMLDSSAALLCASTGGMHAIDRALNRSTLRPVVVAPTHNNAATLPDILRRIHDTALAVIIVNDGSTDATAGILSAWADEATENCVITLRRNLGKAAALRAGFVEAARAGFTHAITIDTDGQLSPEDIPNLLTRAVSNEKALVLGARDAKAADYPARSRFGRWVSNLLVRLETGREISDSQCGLRIYPLRLVNTIRCGAGHYGFETEIITRAIWAATPILEAPVHCRYFAGPARVSHFKPGLDSLRAMGMHLRLIVRAMNPVHPKQAPPGTGPVHSLPRQFLHWLNPLTAWRQIRHTHGARERFSLGFAVGIFLANWPIYGLQSVLGLFIAKRFRLHPVSVLAGANIAIPPLSALLIAGGIATGHLILHGSLPTLESYHLSSGLHAVLLPTIMEWLIGCWPFGAVLAVISFVALDLFLRLVSDPPLQAQPEEPAK